VSSDLVWVWKSVGVLELPELFCHWQERCESQAMVVAWLRKAFNLFFKTTRLGTDQKC